MARDLSPRPFRSILCPVDFSANSRAALRYAAMLARLADSRLVVLYVNDPLLATAAATRHGGRALLASADADLEQFVRAALRRATPPVATTLLTIAGKPPHEIVEAAERHRCDLIVMGYHGVGRASRFLFGSTTEGVVRTTTVPVVAIPPGRRSARLPRADRTGLKRAS